MGTEMKIGRTKIRGQDDEVLGWCNGRWCKPVRSPVGSEVSSEGLKCGIAALDGDNPRPPPRK